MRRSKTRSISMICIRYFMTVVLICVLIYTAANTLYNVRLSRAFPDMAHVLSYRTGVEDNDWAGFESRYPNSRLVVFDVDGKCIYASNQEVEDLIRSEDLIFLSNGDAQYYQVMKLQKGSEEQVYQIFRLSRVDGEQVVLGSCILNSEYRIVSGDLFEDREQLTQHEMDLIHGKGMREYQIECSSYVDMAGKRSSIVLLAPAMTSQAYQRMLKELDRWWILAAAMIVLSVVIGGGMLDRTIRRNLDPMIERIRNYANEDYNEEIVPETVEEFGIIAEEIHKLMGRLDQAQKKQQREEWERRRVVASLTHDLKTPISVILGYTQAFRDNRITADQREHYYEMMCDKARLACDMIDSMSEYTKMEHPDFRLQLEKTELNEFLRQYLMSVYDELTESGVDLYPELGDEGIFCMIDRRMILRVMNNLISNTRKYNPDGVRLRVAVRAESEKVLIVVEDDGIGIAPELRDALFHPFVTSNEARTSGKGTGLGLAIVDRIIQNHGGSIALVDAETEGYHTEFRIELPVVC